MGCKICARLLVPRVQSLRARKGPSIARAGRLLSPAFHKLAHVSSNFKNSSKSGWVFIEELSRFQAQSFNGIQAGFGGLPLLCVGCDRQFLRIHLSVITCIEARRCDRVLLQMRRSAIDCQGRKPRLCMAELRAAAGKTMPERSMASAHAGGMGATPGEKPPVCLTARP